LKELHEDLIKICTRARERGVKVIIDAEYRYVFLFFVPNLD
jgi:proline dehydrogenase